MVFMSLLPVGLTQFFAVLENGYWYGRSPEVIHSPMVEMFVWLRVPGDVLFGLGGMLLALFLFDLLKKSLAKKPDIDVIDKLGTRA